MNLSLNILPKLKIPIVAIMIIFCLYAPKAYAAPAPDSFTTKSYETLPSNALSDAAYGNGVYIAVGYYGAIIRSYDSEIWQNVKTSADINYFGVTNPSSFTFNGAAFGNGKFVVVGAEGVILTSLDGVMWTQSVSGVTTGFSSVEYLQFNGVSAFYAITQGRILKSTDGISWTPVIPTGLDPTKWLTEVTVGNGNTRLAVGDTDGYIYSTTDGTSWSRTRPNNPDGWGASGTNMLTWMNDRYFISDPNAYIWTSTDLQSFTLVGSPFKQSSSQTGNQMFTGFYDGSQYYLFGYQSPYGYGAVYTSTDALSWSMQTFTNEFVTQNAVYINGKYLRLGNEGLQVSSNGSDWSYKWAGTFYEIVYDGTKYIAVGAEKSEGAIWTSTDMANWSKASLSSYVKSFNSVAFGNGKYVAIGGLTGTNTSLANSINGTDWTVKTTINDSSSFSDIAFGNGKFVAVGSNSSTGPVIKTSTDGSTWSAPSLPASSIDALYSVTYVNSQFIALGYGNNSTTGAVDSLSIWTSSDGETWVDKTSSYPNMTDVLNNIIYDGSKYILLGYDSTTYEMFSRSSADLITWSDTTVMTGVYTLYGSSAQIAQKGSNIYVLVTDYDWNPVVYFTSDQGQTWQNAAISDLTGKAPYALMPVNNQIVIAGDSKLVMTTVVVDTPPAITGQPQDQAKIVGENASFSVTATGTELSYQWQVNTGVVFEDIIDNSIYSGATTDSLVVTGTPISLNGYKYRVVVSGKTLPQAISEEAYLTVEKKDITGISFNNLTTTYDGSAKTIQLSGTLPTGVDVAYINNTQTNAGTYTAVVTIIGGTDYKDTTYTAVLTIEKAMLAATVGDYSKIYGEENPAFTVNVTGFVNGESPATAAGYIAPTAGSSALASTGAGTESIVISGGASTNYSFNLSDTGILTINKKALTAAATANDKVYDGTKTATGTVALDGTLFSDDVTATGNFEFTDAKASTGKTVNVTNIKLGGAKASNYNLNSSSVTTIANVTQQTVTANVYAYDKVFDNNTTATGYITLVGVVGSDDVTGSGNFAFEDSAVGMNKIVNVTDIKLSGADAGNYVLDNTTSTTNANISKEISSIAVTTLPEKTVYEYGEEFNPYGTVITVTYNDSSKSTVSLFDSMYTVANNPLIGDRIVSVSYLGKTTTFIISFNKATQSQPGAPVCIVAEGGIKVTSPVGENYEYSIDGGVNWQSEDTFINLTPGIEYTITARLKGTTTHNESAASIGTKVTFLDIVKPNLTVVRATRISDTEAIVNIFTNEAGKYYSEVVSTGAPAPEINTAVGGTDCQAGETEIHFNLTPGGKDIYIKVKDLAGNVSDISKIEIPAYVMTNAEKALTDLNDLTWNVVKGSNTYTNSVTEDLNLTVTGAVYGTNISWVSSNPQILSITGKITRPAYSQGDVSVTVTASVYNGGAGYTKSFDLIVLKNLASTNADLTKATISSGTLDTEFSSNILSYNSSVSYSTRSITITPISADAFATVKVNGNSLTGGSYTVELNTGNNLITIEVTAQDGITKKVYTINMYRSSRSSSGDNTSDNNSGSEQPQTPGSSDNGVDVLVNGKAESSGTANTTNEGELIKTTITVDPQKLVQRLEAAGNNPTVTIPLNTKSDIIVGELNGDMIKTMESKEAVLEIKTDTASYRLPSQEVNIDSISTQLGTNIELKDIKVQVEISKPTNEVVKVVEDTANKGNFSIVVPPLEFSVTCQYNDKKIEVSAFKAYVERLIAIPEGVDPNKITTGVVIDSDGSVRHVPTKVVVQDGKYYASINSLTNSTYSVIWNPIEFKDVDNHWAKEDVNDMGSRMVITGVGNDSFEPDRDITRAEFAAIIVRALGLKPVTGKVPFSDLSSTEWYVPYVNTAYEHGIVSGYGDGNFGPSDKITREQAMTMIARVMKITELKVELNAKEIETLLAGFSDSDQSDEWAKESIAECIKAGVVNGKSNEIVAPKDNITRAEVAAIIRRLLQKSSLI